MASFRSVEELRSTYPQEDSDTDSEPGKTASLNMKRKTKQNKKDSCIYRFDSTRVQHGCAKCASGHTGIAEPEWTSSISARWFSQCAVT
jgi:hypothetical protein